MHCLLHLFMSGLCGVQEGRHHRHQSSDSMQRSSILAPRCWSAPSINTVTSLHLYLRNAVSNSVGTKTWCCQCGQWQTLVCIWAWASSAWQLIHGCTYITRSWHILNTYMSTYILNASTTMNSKVSSACLHPCLVSIWRLFCNIGSQHWTSLMSVLCFFFLSTHNDNFILQGSSRVIPWKDSSGLYEAVFSQWLKVFSLHHYQDVYYVGLYRQYFIE